MLRRGFKSQCERRAVEVRKDFNLLPADPMSAIGYATAAGITVWSERDIEELPQADRDQLTIDDPDSWSAFVIRINHKHLVLFNSTQPQARVNSVVMHELSHILLGHKLTSAGISEDGHLLPTVYDQDQEDEANWLAGTLLLPRPALLKIRYDRMTDDAAMENYGVSREMLTWRLRMTGVDFQLGNRRAS